MLEKVRRYIEQWHMLESEDCVIVGVSGGADSLCLLFVLLELQKQIPFRLIACHVNHGLRGEEADADEAYVKKICAEYKISCESCFENVELIAKKRKQSTEEAGREVRRAFFEKVLLKYGGTKIALAHHKNDNVETFFLNLARGSGLKGLCGIHPVKGNVIRPLLCVERSEIEAYLEERGIGYCEDKTNTSDLYTRNRIRNHVIPYLQEEVNAQVVSHIDETTEYLRLVQDFLEEQTEIFFAQSVVKKEEEYLILEETYKNIPNVLQPLVLRKALSELAGREKDLEAVHVRSLQELLKKQTGRRVDLPYQMVGRRTYQGIEIEKKKEEEDTFSEIIFDCKSEWQKTFFIQGKEIVCRVFEKTSEMLPPAEKNNTKWFDCDIMENRLSFRTRKPGDYITIHSDGSRQKLKSYFINEKIPQKERDQILLAADGSHILWIVGHRLNCIYEVSEKTKRILEIQINNGAQ